MRPTTPKILFFLLTTVGCPAQASAQQASAPIGNAPIGNAAGGNAASVPDAAQPGAPPPPAAGDIVVTARRRVESLSRVPVSITAINAVDLVRRGIRSEADLQLSTPGVTVRQNLSQNQINFAIRGQSVDSFSNSSPGVLPYINEVQISANTATSFFDLQGIQIVKGPQGTLFGRNATGGAILYQTKDPTDDFGGYITARHGNYDTTGIQGAVNIPVSDKFLVRVAADHTKGDGYVHNLYRNTYTGAPDNTSVRLSIILKPTSSLTNKFVGQYGWFGGTNVDPDLYSVNGCGATNNGYTLVSGAACLYNPAFPGFAAFLAAHPGSYPNGLVAELAYVKTLGKFTSYADFPARHRARVGFVSNATTYEISSALTIKNIIGLTRSHSNDQDDLEGSSYPVFGARSPADPIGESYSTSQFSDEFQLQGKALAGRLNYIVGGYYSYQRDHPFYPLLAFDLSPAVPGSEATYGWATVDRSRAVFAQGTYKFSGALEHLSMTAGVRYTWETYGLFQQADTLYAYAAPEQSKFSKPSWTFGLDYQLTPSLLAYAATRGSWRTGGFNGLANPINATAQNNGNLFLPETVRDVEVGAKYAGRAGGVPLRINVALYNLWVSDIQRSVYATVNNVPLSFTVNVPKAEITGVEADANVRPLDFLEFGGAVAYTNARFTKSHVSFFGSSADLGPYADTPKWSGSVYMQATAKLGGDAGQLIGRVEIYGQSFFYFSNLDATVNPGTKLPGYHTTNLRVDWDKPFALPVTLSGYVKNVGNRGYYVGGVPEGVDLGINNASWGQPRTYGAELSVRF